MKLYFRKNKLAKACNEEQECKKVFGERAPTIQARMTQLRAAPNLGEFDIPPLKTYTGFHPLIDDREGQYAVDAGLGSRIILLPLVPATSLADVTEIVILEVINYHH